MGGKWLGGRVCKLLYFNMHLLNLKTLPLWSPGMRQIIKINIPDFSQPVSLSKSDDFERDLERFLESPLVKTWLTMCIA